MFARICPPCSTQPPSAAVAQRFGGSGSAATTCRYFVQARAHDRPLIRRDSRRGGVKSYDGVIIHIEKLDTHINKIDYPSLLGAAQQVRL